MGPSSFGYYFLAAFFLSLAAFYAFSASSFNRCCISSSFSGRIKVSITHRRLSLLSSTFYEEICLKDSISFLD